MPLSVPFGVFAAVYVVGVLSAIGVRCFCYFGKQREESRISEMNPESLGTTPELYTRPVLNQQQSEELTQNSAKPVLKASANVQSFNHEKYLQESEGRSSSSLKRGSV